MCAGFPDPFVADGLNSCPGAAEVWGGGGNEAVEGVVSAMIECR